MLRVSVRKHTDGLSQNQSGTIMDQWYLFLSEVCHQVRNALKFDIFAVGFIRTPHLNKIK